MDEKGEQKKQTPDRPLATDEHVDRGVIGATAAVLTNTFDTERYILMMWPTGHDAPVPMVIEPGDTVELSIADLLGRGTSLRIGYRHGSLEAYSQKKELQEVDDMLKNIGDSAKPDSELN